ALDQDRPPGPLPGTARGGLGHRAPRGGGRLGPGGVAAAVPRLRPGPAVSGRRAGLSLWRGKRPAHRDPGGVRRDERGPALRRTGLPRVLADRVLERIRRLSWRAVRLGRPSRHGDRGAPAVAVG